MTATRSESAGLRAGRDAIASRPALTGAERRRALTEFYDRELARLLPPVEGVALIAVGSLARGEPTPYGDIDLVIVHSGISAISKIADEVWYPLWDSGISVDHSVRTIAEGMRMAEQDLAVAMGLIAARPIAGDLELGLDLRTRVRALWRRTASRRLGELVTAAAERLERFGELAFLLEPDVKNAFGGLRELQALHGLAVAQLTDTGGPAVAAAQGLLLDVRGELHHRAGRSLDRLVQQEQPAIAETLGRADADDLLRAVSDAGRTIAFAWENARRRIETAPRRGRVQRRPLADGVVAHGGEVTLARDTRPGSDPGLLLRLATASATSGLPVTPYTVRSFAGAEMPTPWPEPARQALIALLETGRPMVPVVEMLDRTGLWAELFPEWEHVRCLPQRDPVHRFTVDRHLVETVVDAAELVREVDRPDLLLLAALLHDIGKGRGGDHSELGAVVAEPLLRRLGLPDDDVALVVAAVRHHLLLPDTATRRDLDDPATVALVCDALGGSRPLLDILAVLAIADGQATGPAAWNRWKAGLVADLVARTRRALAGATPAPPPQITADQRELAETGDVLVRGSEVTVGGAALSQAAGVFALHRLDVVQATVVQTTVVQTTVVQTTVVRATVDSGVPVAVFTVQPKFGRPPDPERLRADLLRFLPDPVGLQQRLDSLERSNPAGASASQVLWFDDEATGATIVELRAGNAIGLLHRVARALENAGVEVRAARISTLGSAVVDAFYVRSGGQPIVSAAQRESITAALLSAAV
ncbi:MAG TPA: [protein-PII] uridylyltransferase [Mycobacteriales bacterium]|nr:[protein-PII] uridylyltransferase [Mycobacteriales bacterium]